MAHYYVTGVRAIEDDGIMPDIPDGISFCCTYGALGGRTVALVRTVVEIPETERTARSIEPRDVRRPVEDTMRDMGAKVRVSDPIEQWRIRGQ